MADDLMDKIEGMVTPEVIGKAAEATGESPENTHKAIQGAVPTVLAGLTHGASTPGGAARIFGALKEGGTGPDLMNKVFGDRSGAVSDALAKSSGVKSSSASHLLMLALPMIAGVIGKHALSNRLDAGGLSQLLSSQKKAIVDNPNTPPGLASALGAQPVSRGIERPVEAAKKRSRGHLLLPALILGALAVWGISALTRGHAPGVTARQPELPVMPSLHGPEAPSIPNPSVPKVEAPAGGEMPTTGRLTLPGGQTLDVDANGQEAQMARALGDDNISLPHTFEFDNLNFESGTAMVTSDSFKTVDDIAAMLRAYPTARVRLEGHTDSVGDDAANRALSESRATTIASMLTTRGVAGDRIEKAGNSEQSPVAENESEEGRARNRRVGVVLLGR